MILFLGTSRKTPIKIINPKTTRGGYGLPFELGPIFLELLPMGFVPQGATRITSNKARTLVNLVVISTACRARSITTHHACSLHRTCHMAGALMYQFDASLTKFTWAISNQMTMSKAFQTFQQPDINIVLSRHIFDLHHSFNLIIRIPSLPTIHNMK